MGNAVGAAPVLEMARRGMLVGLGTDGYAMDMFEACARRTSSPSTWLGPAGGLGRGAADGFREQHGHPCAALERAGRVGAGAYADMIAVDHDPPTPLTEANWFSHVLFGLPGAAVNTIVGGQVLMRDGELLTVDERELAARPGAGGGAVEQDIRESGGFWGDEARWRSRNVSTTHR